MNIALVVNSNIEDDLATKKLIVPYDFVVAVDGGLIHCDRMGIAPDLIIGDLDSTPKELLAKYSRIRLVQFPTDKDLTDLEIALQEINSLEVDKLTIFGGMGGRTDHYLYHLHLLSRMPGKLFLESEKELQFVIQNEVNIFCKPGQTISLIPLFGQAKNVTTEGLKWQLKEASLDSNFMSLSNICLSHQVKVKVDSGSLLCCLLK